MPLEYFDPNSPGIDNGNYFGLPFSVDEAALALVSVPWDVTTSYGDGTAAAPEAIIAASLQVDLFDLHNHEGWKQGIATVGMNGEIAARSAALRREARKVIAHLEEGAAETDDTIAPAQAKVNEGSQWLNGYVYDTASTLLAAGKKVGVVGGDHSVPLGLIKAVGERNPGFGILHIDAHADLREAYEGFHYSHASIMYNVLQEVPAAAALVQVGVRDLSDEEYELGRTDIRVTMLDDYGINEAKFRGQTWDAICERIVGCLPEKVYVSFDIDGLSPDNCPGTGTPVPGGLSFHEAIYLVNKVRESGREIVAFDLCEVAPSGDDEFDANIGARVLYKLCNITLKT